MRDRHRIDTSHGMAPALEADQRASVEGDPHVSVALRARRRRLREKERATLLRSVRIEPLGDYIARLAGIAIGLVPGAGTIDAIVMASASLRGDAVYTSDPNDLEMLRAIVPQFANVRILAA